jgi:hypothetical protein
MVSTDAMPKAGPKLTAGQKEEIRAWIAAGAPVAHVPKPDANGTDLWVRDRALEACGVDRVVRGAHGEALFLRVETRPLRHRPALQDAVELQSQIEMRSPLVRLLHDKVQLLLAWLALSALLGHRPAFLRIRL